MKKLLNKLMLIAFVLTSIQINVMAQEKEKNIPDYSSSDRKDIPVEYTWKTEDIYNNIEAWKADVVKMQDMISQIKKVSENWISDAKKMYALLNLQNDIKIIGSKLYSYVSHQKNADMGNSQLQSMQGEIQAIFVKLGTELSFINPDILKLGDKKFKEFVAAEPKLQPYSFMIRKVLNKKDHILPDEQQKIVSMTGLFSEVPEDASQMLNDLEIPSPEVTLSDGKKVILNTANYMLYRSSKNAGNRKLVFKSFLENQKKFEKTHSVLLNGAIKQHFFSSQVYKYPDCLSAKLAGDSIPMVVYNNLINRVHNNLDPLHRFMKIKSSLMKIDKMDYTDMFASAVEAIDKKYTYDESKQIILESMKPLGQKYADGLNRAFNNRWIDVYPNKGKESGAYSSGLYGVHPFIKLNYNGKYDALSTTTHELGHAMHSWFADNKQHYSNSRYSTFIAEIASTFNENMLLQHLLKNETDDMFKLFLLDSYLDQVRATMYHQVMFAEFELNMHKQVEAGKSLTSEWLNSEYLRLIKFYYGHDKNVCHVSDYFQIGWSLIPHFYMNYYVFQYSTGIIASMALCDKVLSGNEKDRDKYLEMLEAGGNDYPIEILKKAGVDMTSNEPYDAAFKYFDKLTAQMEQLVAKLKQQGKLK